jgi:hypothetical protein
VGLFSRPEPLPDVVKRELVAGEHVLAWTHHPGGVIAVTDKKLISTDQHVNQSIAWHDTLSAKWHDPLLTLVVAHRDEQPQVLSWLIDEPGLVPIALRDRVTSVIIVDKSMDIPEVGHVRFVARRTPAGVQWTTIPDAAIQGESVDVQERIKSALRNLRSVLGV